MNPSGTGKPARISSPRLAPLLPAPPRLSRPNCSNAAMKVSMKGSLWFVLMVFAFRHAGRGYTLPLQRSDLARLGLASRHLRRRTPLPRSNISLIEMLASGLPRLCPGHPVRRSLCSTGSARRGSSCRKGGCSRPPGALALLREEYIRGAPVSFHKTVCTIFLVVLFRRPQHHERDG